NKGGPVLNCRRRWCEFTQSVHWVALLGHLVEETCGSDWSSTGQKLDDTETGDTVKRVFGPAQKRKHVFDVCSLEKLQATEFHERDVAPGQFYFKWAAVMGGAEQNSLRFQCEPRFTVFQDLLDD